MKKLLRWLLTTSPLAADVGLLAMRLSVGLMLAVAHGVTKVRNLDAFVAQVDKMDLAHAQLLGVCAALAEFLGGLLLAVGLFSRGAAVAVLVTMGVAAFQVHGGDPFAKQELAIVYGLGALALLLAGPGRISLDHMFFGRKDRPVPADPEPVPSEGDAPRLIPPPPKVDGPRANSTADWLKPDAARAPVLPPLPKDAKVTKVAKKPKL